MKLSIRKLLFSISVLGVLIMYLPTLRTGFLTDDFLDCSHSLSDVPSSFLDQAGGGYRPLMIISWAIDNAIWGVTASWGWHLTNLLVFMAAAFSVRLFLRRFIGSKFAVNAATVLFLFSYPVAVSVAKVSWRTTLLALIPFLMASVFFHKWGRKSERKLYLIFGVLLYLASLLIKETALAAAPVLALAAFCGRTGPGDKKNAVIAFVSALAAVAIYALLRYNALGFWVNYGESTQFGLFMIRNICIQNAAVWSPWLSGLPARILVLLFPIAVYFSTSRWRHRFLLLSLGFFLLLPVSNLPARTDLAVAALPGAVLFTAFVSQRLQGSRALIPLLFVLIAGIYSSSFDEVKLIGGASRSVEVQTDWIAEIAVEVPGGGPLFLSGVTEEIGVYGTFWPGEYMVPLRCAGIRPERYIGSACCIWETLAETDSSGYLVFMSPGQQYSAFPVSRVMYSELPDTSVLIAGVQPAGDLTDYPTCIASDGSLELGLLLPWLSDTVTYLEADLYSDQWFFDLASSPLWLTGDSNVVILYRGSELTFISRNISLEKAEDRLISKRTRST